MTVKFSERINNLKASEIREILKITEQPHVISFAGGLPAPELFPVEEMKLVTQKVLEEEGRQALQYTTTEGFTPLRKIIAQRMNIKFGTALNYENILIISGSQQGLDFSGKILLNEGDVVLCESPTYLGAINAFRSYGPRFIEVPTDEKGMITEELEKIINKADRIKMVYVIPDFQNPTGRTWSVERREKFMEIISRYEIPVIEDNPYGELRFEGYSPKSLKALDTKGLVIFLGTFSKIFCPGYRIGWVAAEEEILEKYILVKQGSDLQSSTIGQREIARYLEMFDLDGHIGEINRVYKARRDLAISTMQKEFPGNLSFTRPEGGLFTWVELPPHVNARGVLVRSLERDVAFVPGGSFYPNGGHENTLRLNYSNMSEDRLVEGIRRLGSILDGYTT
ncbi:MAG: PLP-dependent aminotransferase family protein [Firmicutes bacterium]|nr:PLP-dependent aminotransferase family protein [Bacillota bacterium]